MITAASGVCCVRLMTDLKIAPQIIGQSLKEFRELGLCDFWIINTVFQFRVLVKFHSKMAQKKHSACVPWVCRGACVRDAEGRPCNTVL